MRALTQRERESMYWMDEEDYWRFNDENNVVFSRDVPRRVLDSYVLYCDMGGEDATIRYVDVLPPKLPWQLGDLTGTLKV